MSEDLRERLSLKLNFKTMDNILFNSKSLTFVEYLEDSPAPNPISIWERIASFDSQPSHKIPEAASIDDINFKFQEILKERGIDNEIYLSIGSIGNLPWAKVKVVDKDLWLVEFWTLGYHELIVLNIQKDKAVGLLEEENFYEIYSVVI